MGTVRAQHRRVEVAEDRQLVFAADRGQHRLDRRVGEGRLDVARAVGRRRAEHAGGRELHRLQPERVAESAQAQLVHLRKQRRQPGGGRQDRDARPRSWLRGVPHTTQIIGSPKTD